MPWAGIVFLRSARRVTRLSSRVPLGQNINRNVTRFALYKALKSIA